jgi:hypothetical protein
VVLVRLDGELEGGEARETGETAGGDAFDSGTGGAGGRGRS